MSADNHIDDLDAAATAQLDTPLAHAEVELPLEPVVEAVAEVPTEEATEEGQPLQKVLRHNVLLTFDINAQNKINSADAFSLPSASDADVERIISSLPNIALTDSEQGRVWAGVLRDSLNRGTMENWLDGSLAREGADWRQAAQNDKGKPISGGFPRWENNDQQSESKMSGSQAVVRLLNHFGLGNLYSAPMWHSGFWVTFKPAVESAMADLNHLIAADKIDFGRYSYGLAFSNTTSYTTERLLRFAVEHIYETSINPNVLAKQDILSLLRVQDIPLFLHGFLCSVYPRGFNYRRACCNDALKCQHVTEETLNLRFLSMVDNSRLNDFQRNHMVTRRSRGAMTLEDIKNYQAQFAGLQNREFTITQGYTNATAIVDLTSPSADEHIRAGHRWLSGMTEMVEAALGRDADTAERNSLLRKHGMASILNQFSHWISGLRFNKIETDDRETVDNDLTQLSADDELREQITAAVKVFIEDSTIAVIGLPAYECPACGAPQAEVTAANPMRADVIPLDVIHVFLALVRQRVARLMSRL